MISFSIIAITRGVFCYLDCFSTFAFLRIQNNNYSLLVKYLFCYHSIPRDGFVNNKNDTSTVAVKAKFCNTNFEDDFPLLLFLVISNGY